MLPTPKHRPTRSGRAWISENDRFAMAHVAATVRIRYDVLRPPLVDHRHHALDPADAEKLVAERAVDQILVVASHADGRQVSDGVELRAVMRA